MFLNLRVLKVGFASMLILFTCCFANAQEGIEWPSVNSNILDEDNQGNTVENKNAADQLPGASQDTSVKKSQEQIGFDSAQGDKAQEDKAQPSHANSFDFAQPDSIAKDNEIQPDNSPKPDSITTDPVFFPSINLDSIRAREAFIRDSIALREAFVRDSIIKREAFIRDSIIKRQKRIDSLKLLSTQFSKLLEASYKTESQDIILNTIPVSLVGDSALGDFKYNKLILHITHPYRPWEKAVNLSTHPLKYGMTNDSSAISYIKTDKFTHKYTQSNFENTLVIQSGIRVLSKKYGKLYCEPIDTVFYDSQNRIVKIKRYENYSEVTPNYKKGAHMYLHLKEVRQFVYSPTNKLSKIEIVKFCDRWRKIDPHKLCSIITYNLRIEGNTYVLTRKYDPENKFAEGTFTYEYEGKDLKLIEFKNKKTEVQLNENKNVYRYLYFENDKITHSIVFEYHNGPNAKHKAESITYYYEDDGISYRKVNNTTGKVKVRDRLTMEWGEWQ